MWCHFIKKLQGMGDVNKMPANISATSHEGRTSPEISMTNSSMLMQGEYTGLIMEQIRNSQESTPYPVAYEVCLFQNLLGTS
jgi:hypothetical protein